MALYILCEIVPGVESPEVEVLAEVGWGGEQLLVVPVEAGKDETMGSRMRRRSPVSRRMATKQGLVVYISNGFTCPC